MIEAGIRNPAFLSTVDFQVSCLLPLVEISRQAKVTGAPFRPSEFTSPEGDMSIDIYTNTLCYGAGNKVDPKLCDYCFLSKAQLKDGNMMSLNSFNQILTWFTSDGVRTNEQGKPRKTVSLLGGEFALHRDAKDMIKKVHAAGLNMHIVTSGSDEFRELLKDNEIVSILSDESRDNLVAVSLDSISEELNDRHRNDNATRNALATIDILSDPDCKIPFRINVTATTTVLPGLYDLYTFAYKRGAREVLIHYPSVTGSGRSLSYKSRLFHGPKAKGDSIPQAPEVPNARVWEQYVLNDVRDFNSEIGQPNFVVCQSGARPTVSCELLEKRSSLQFAPQMSISDPDIPVVACGLNMDSAKTLSGYILRNDELVERAGDSELIRARLQRQIYPDDCPFEKFPGNPYGTRCIYDIFTIKPYSRNQVRMRAHD